MYVPMSEAPRVGGREIPAAAGGGSVGAASAAGAAKKVVAVRAPRDFAYLQDMRVVPEHEEVTQTKLVPAMPAILEGLRLHRAAVDRECEELRQRPDPTENRRHCGLPLAS